MRGLRRIVGALMCAAMTACTSTPPPLRVGTTYTVQQSGALDRGDSSGTQIKELALWTAARVRPQGAPWYLESGADQTTTLQLAAERGAYALADLPTFRRLPDLGLRVLFTADTLLGNPYTLYVVRLPVPHPAARAFAAWAQGPWRDALLARRLPHGSPAFDRRAGACTAGE